MNAQRRHGNTFIFDVKGWFGRTQYAETQKHAGRLINAGLIKFGQPQEYRNWKFKFKFRNIGIEKSTIWISSQFRNIGIEKSTIWISSHVIFQWLQLFLHHGPIKIFRIEKEKDLKVYKKWLYSRQVGQISNCQFLIFETVLLFTPLSLEGLHF